MADELARWAAGRAPELLRRAEREALGELRRALLEAALGPRREPNPTPRTERATGDALWAYCVMRAGERAPEVTGIEGERLVRIESGALAVLVSRVPLAEFGAEPLRDNLNDIAWLERVARAHEAVLESALAATTIVPLRLCTIFESEAGVRRMLRDERESLAGALELLDGRQEWGVKLLVDGDKLASVARTDTEETDRPDDELADRAEGGAYMLRRRFERRTREVADALAAEVAEDVHSRLRAWATDAVSLPPQNRDLSHHEGDMLLNGAYLVASDRIDGLRELVAELERHHRPLGARLELTGPWPPYNFVPRGATA
jgi:hypothetical protein